MSVRNCSSLVMVCVCGHPHIATEWNSLWLVVVKWGDPFIPSVLLVGWSALIYWRNQTAFIYRRIYIHTGNYLPTVRAHSILKCLFVPLAHSCIAFGSSCSFELNWVVDCMIEGLSKRATTNSSGSSTVSWGTLFSIDASSEWSPSTAAVCRLPVIQRLHPLWHINSWPALSKVLA